MENMMEKIKYGCQTYPWKMAQGKYEGNLPHIVQTAAKAGFEGLEAELVMMGSWLDDPEKSQKVFEENGIELTALVFHQSCKAKRLDEQESTLLDKVLEFLTAFPHSRLMVSHQANPGERSENREILRNNRENLMSCLDEIADRAGEYGIVAAFHPNSSVKSLFRTRDDYLLMFEMLAKTDMGYAPDIGHIVNGGMDPMEILQLGRNKIRHVHFKDYYRENEWAVMGEGCIDYPKVVRYLEETNYKGWIMVEDESTRAVDDPDGVVIADGAYVAGFRK